MSAAAWAAVAVLAFGFGLSTQALAVKADQIATWTNARSVVVGGLIAWAVIWCPFAVAAYALVSCAGFGGTP